MKNQKQVFWRGGRQGNGYITDWQPAKAGSKYPTVGDALYVALCKDGSIAWSERRPMAESRAKEMGLL